METAFYFALDGGVIRAVPPSGGSLEIGNPRETRILGVLGEVKFPLRGDP